MATGNHSSSSVFIHKDLSHSSHVFLRRDAVKRSLCTPYDGPYPVIKRFGKTYTLLVKGKEVVVNIDRVKPAFMSADKSTDQPDSSKNTEEHSRIPTGKLVEPDTSQHSKKRSQMPAEERTTTVTRYGRTVRFRIPVPDKKEKNRCH